MQFAIAVGMLNGKCEDFLNAQRVQWTPLLLVISIFACEKPHSVALGLLALRCEIHHNTNSFILHSGVITQVCKTLDWSIMECSASYLPAGQVLPTSHLSGELCLRSLS